MSYLNQSELQALERLNADSYAMQALKKVILKRICFDGTLEEGTPADPLRNFMLNVVDAIGKELSDAELGALTRARRVAVELLEQGVKDLEKYKHIKTQKPKEINYK